MIALAKVGLQIEIDFGHVLEGFDEVTHIMKRDVPSILEIVGNQAHGTVKDLTPVDTGKLRGGWKNSGVTGSGGDYQVRIYNNIPYVYYVENGFFMHRHFVPYGAEGNNLTGSGGFMSPEKYVDGRHMAHDTAEIYSAKMTSVFGDIGSKIEACFK